MSIPAGYKCNQWGWFWKESDNSGPYYLDADGVMTQGLPSKLYTDDGGEYSRLRVDVGQTGFWAAREFKTTHEFSILSGASQVIKVVAPVNTVLYNFSVELSLAELRAELVSGGTEGGAFNVPLSILKTNNMTTGSAYVGQVTMAAGGTHTGGTLAEVLTVVSGAVAVKAVVQSAEEDYPIGFAPGTYYIRLINTNGNTAIGIFKARWEERP